LVRSARYRKKENEDQEIIGLVAMGQLKHKIGFALCIENRDCDDLEKGKVYKVLPDKTAAKESYLRVVDESREDYLYPESYFVLLDLPKKAQDALSMPADQ
jgi:hypothetical protein